MCIGVGALMQINMVQNVFGCLFNYYLGNNCGPERQKREPLLLLLEVLELLLLVGVES